MRTKIVVTLLAFMGAVALHAQTAERIEQIGNEPQITVGAAAYLAAASAGIIQDNATAEEALQALADRGFPADAAGASDPARLDHFSYMLMLAHNRPGGLMYSLLRGPRYAMRELEYQRILRGGGDPGDPLTGIRALRLTGRMLTIVEEEG